MIIFIVLPKEEPLCTMQKNRMEIHIASIQMTKMKKCRYYDVEREVKKALNQNELSIVYQTLVNLENDQIVGVEALLRWDNPKLGSVSPEEFIPLLEELGDIISVGKWVLKSVCKQMNTWHDNGILIERASVNASPIQFRDKNFVNHVKQILKETHLHPKYLELEITEGTILHKDKTEEILNQLRYFRNWIFFIKLFKKFTYQYSKN